VNNLPKVVREAERSGQDSNNMQSVAEIDATE